MILKPRDRMPKVHPRRQIKELVGGPLTQLSAPFDKMSCTLRRPSTPHERLLKTSQLLMALCAVHSDLIFCEQLDHNLLLRRFFDLDVAEPNFDHSTSPRNQARLLEHDAARAFFTRVVCGSPLLSDEHLKVYGALAEV